MFRRVSMSSMVVAVSLAAAVFGTGCAAASAEDTADGAGAQSIPSSTLARSYQGTIGTLKVMARLQVSGATITGSYFYADKESNGDALVLTGTATGTKLALSEAVNGTASGSFDTKIGNGTIIGTWKSPNGATSLPVSLTAVKDGTLLSVTRKFKDTAPAAEAGSLLTTCETTASYLEVFGLGSLAAENAINKKLAPAKVERDAAGKCDYASSLDITQEVTFDGQGFLSISINTGSDGGAHPDNSFEYANFKLADGSQLSGKDFFAANAKDAVKALIAKEVGSDADARDAFDMHWQSVDTLDAIQFGITDKGLSYSMIDNYAHVDVALAPTAALTWAQLKPVLKSDSPILPLVK